jgi:undecaprenyl-diphosphatase
VTSRFEAYDHGLFEAVARLSVPFLDAPLRRVSDFADFSKPWFLTAGALAVFGGPRGRRAAVTGLSAIGATSLLVNQPLKRLTSDRARPDRATLGVPVERWVRMPSSKSFPSGHSASAAAFAVSVGHLLPGLRIPLRAAASVVAFSRVYTGVHYPSDVLVGITIGALVGHFAARLARGRGGPLG